MIEQATIDYMLDTLKARGLITKGYNDDIKFTDEGHTYTSNRSRDSWCDIVWSGDMLWVPVSSYEKIRGEMDSITRKIFEKCKGNKTIMDISTIEGYRGPHEGFFGVIGSHRHPDSKFISDDYGLFTTYRETCGNKLIFFDSENERKNCFNYLTSKLLKYYSSKIRTNQRIPWQFVPVIDFKEDCTDSYLKKYFGLTDEEYKNIFCLQSVKNLLYYRPCKI